MKENLFTKNGESYKKEAFLFCDKYKEFLSEAKTERLCTKYFEEEALKNGFENIENKTSFKKGDKVYYINNHRSAVFAVIGGALILVEGMTVREIWGCVLMISAVILANTKVEQRI